MLIQNAPNKCFNIIYRCPVGMQGPAAGLSILPFVGPQLKEAVTQRVFL